MTQITTTRLLLSSFAATAIFVLFRCLSNVYLHPLAKFPGPRLAAASGLYKAYIDVIAKTGFVRTLERAHSQYGRYPASNISYTDRS